MVIELKTLRELRNDDDAADEKYIEKWKVRQEAIRYHERFIKQWEDTDDITESMICAGVQRFIEIFFDLPRENVI